MQSMIIFLCLSVPEGRLFALDGQALISMGIQLLNGIILAVALGYILYKPIKKFMDNRTHKIQNKIEHSDSTMARANELIAEYESKIKNIDKEYERVLQEARIKAADERKIILADAHKEADRIKKRSIDGIEAEKERIRLETRPYIIELSTLMAENYIAQTIEKDEQEKIFDDALAQLEEAQWLR